MRVSLGDYARQKETTYEAVRKQVKRYEQELEGHIFKEGRTRFLDEYAVEFLEERRNKNPVTIINNNKADELVAAKEEIAELKAKIQRLENKNDHLTAQMTELASALVDKGERLDAANDKLLALAEAKQEEQPQHKGWFAKLFGG